MVDTAPGPDATGCQADETRCVDSFTLETCSDGRVVHTTCPCTGAPGAAGCGSVVPSNGLNPNWLSGATGALTIPDGERWTIQTTTGEIRTCSGTVIRPAGNDVINQIRYTPLSGRRIGVFALDRLTIGANAELYVLGVPGPQQESRGYALGLLAAVEVDIRGKLIASGGPRACYHDTACGASLGNPRCGGSGGFNGGEVNQNGFGPGAGTNFSDTSGDQYGGGGGGFGANGGAGGKGGAPLPSGGLAYGDATLDPLVGGSGGAGGHQDDTAAGTGGGGGGAIQITTLSMITVQGGGTIVAAGGGGQAAGGSSAQGGGGGGAGGAILLEAPLVRLDSALLSANGGGGGGGGAGGSNTAGSPGTTGTGRAPGGMGSGGNGGAGGALNAWVGAMGSVTTMNNDVGTGGGGGAVGRIYIRSHVNGLTRAGSTVISPAPGAADDLVQ